MAEILHQSINFDIACSITVRGKGMKGMNAALVTLFY